MDIYENLFIIIFEELEKTVEGVKVYDFHIDYHKQNVEEVVLILDDLRV